MKKFILIIFLILGIAGTAFPLTTFSYSGVITQAAAGAGIGDQFVVNYSFNENATDTDVDPTVGIYTSNGSAYNMSVNIFTSSGIINFTKSGWMRIIVNDQFLANSGNLIDRYVARTSNTVSGIPFGDIRLRFRSLASVGSLSSDALPLTPLDPGSFASTLLQIDASAFGSTGIIEGTVSQVIPEPATISLFSLGVVGLAGFLKKRRQS